MRVQSVKRKAKIFLLIIAFMFMTQEAKANNSLTFPNTPVKQLSVEGKWNKVEKPGVDPGKGTVYQSENNSDELGVCLLDAAIPAATQKILSGATGALSQPLLTELGKSENPWILRYCAERGKPELTKINDKTLFVSEFSQEERIRIAAPNGGAQCIPAAKLETHAFAIKSGKLVHMYLVRNLRADRTEGYLESLKKQFRAILASTQWQ